MTPPEASSGWHVRLIKPRLPWGANHFRAPEIGEALSAVLLTREYALEDAQFQKIVPNLFVVEMHESSYLQFYQPIEARVLQQWRSMMLEQLATANTRQGRSLYQLGAPLRIEIRPVPDLEPTHVRILCRVQKPSDLFPSAGETGKSTAEVDLPAAPCLMMLSGEKRWSLRAPLVLIGRDAHCDILLDMPEVQDRRLISSEHAHLRLERGLYVLYDGSPDGKPSLNGTYVNYQRVTSAGRILEDDDLIILASLDAADPRPDAPGVVALRFRRVCL